MTRWTEEDLARLQKLGASIPSRALKKPSKWCNVKVKCDGYTFASKDEHRRYEQLILLEKAGELTELSIHPRFSLDVNGYHIGNYTGDFGYLTPAGYVLEDVKSPVSKKARDYPLRKKLMRAIHGINITEIS